MANYKFIIAALTLCAVNVLAKDSPMSAIAYIEGPDGVKGNITFTQKECGENVYVRVYITGLPAGKHGFHVHEKGDLTNGCTSTGGHYNPDKMDHGGPDDEVRHAGDLGNIEANAQGIADTTFGDRYITLTGPRTIIGRAVVVHEKVDDLGKGGHVDSKKTGNAGGRIGCGVIGINMDVDEWPCGKSGVAPTFSYSIAAFLTLAVAAILYRDH